MLCGRNRPRNGQSEHRDVRFAGRARLPIERWLRWLQRCDMRLRYALLGLRDRARGCQHEGLRQLRGLRRQHIRAGDLAARLYRMRFGRASRMVRDRQHAEVVGSMVASGFACAEWRPNSAPTEPPTVPSQIETWSRPLSTQYATALRNPFPHPPIPWAYAASTMLRGEPTCRSIISV